MNRKEQTAFSDHSPQPPGTPLESVTEPPVNQNPPPIT